MDYKATLNLPKTAFPMKADLPKREPLILGDWLKKDIYRLIQEKSKGKLKYILHDGPPYANGNIHIGHALNKTLKDIIVKYKTMQGLDSAYVPGWDCHGLPVEHQLFKELGINKHQIRQLDFRKKAYAYAVKFVDIQREEFKRLGVFGDWSNPYLTLDKHYEEVIVRSFGALVKKGYVYRGLKPVNWCYVCETALAEAEVEYEEHNSPSIYVKFEILGKHAKLKDILPPEKKLYALVWTTTPWTLIANVAIAVHPNFKYTLIDLGNEAWIIQEDLVSAVTQNVGVNNYKILGSVLGKELEHLPYRDIFLPVRKTNLRFVLADYVSKEEGTGCVHTAPGHGQEDYLTGQKYALETLMPVNSKGEFFQEISIEFKGQHVFEANKNIIEKLRNQGDLAYSGTVAHTYPHCWRCKTPIIFRATEQWFLSIDKDGLRQRLLEAVGRDIAWIPAVGKERISAMIALRPDWCLSRQRYWGVPIPAITCENCAKEFLLPEVIDAFADKVADRGSDVWFSQELKEFLPDGFQCPQCQCEKFIKDNDILDVWFDSGVSHQAVLKKRPELEFPCALYLEGSDQHRGWFQSSLIPSMCIDGKPPFKNVLTHGHVVDKEGRKMSKSLGNVIPPQDIINDYGVDVLRLWVAASDYNEDIRISPEIVSRLAEAYRKIRNTARFILSNLFDFNPQADRRDYAEMKKIDKWALLQLDKLLNSVNAAYERFEFYSAYKEIYDFCNETLSMYYLDMLKGRLYTYAANSLERRAAQSAIYEVLSCLVRITAPILAFTAEEIWQNMPKEEREKSIASVHLLDWPQRNPEYAKFSDDELRPILELIPEVAKALEDARGRGEIGSSFDAQIILLTNDEIRYKYLESLEADLPEILKVSQVHLKNKQGHQAGLVSSKCPEISFVVKKAEGEKCVRCWNYSTSINKTKSHPSLCQRCEGVIGEEKANCPEK